MADDLHAEENGIASSPWLKHTRARRPALDGRLEADAVIVGAGLVGSLVAAELTGRGLNVIVLERQRIAGGTTGHSTAKITVLHETDWSRIIHLHPLNDALWEWASLNAAAPAMYHELIDRYGIECGFRRLDGYLCERLGATDTTLAGEWSALRAIGLDIEDAGPVGDSPFGGVVALRLAGQGQFDSTAFAAGLFDALPENRLQVFESSAVRTLARSGGRWEARTDNGSVTAPIAVMASLAPVRDPTLLFARLYPYAHYAVETHPQRRSDGLWMQVNGSGLTARPTDEAQGPWIFSGSHTRLGTRPDERAIYRRLFEDVHAETLSTDQSRWWSTHDFSTPDGLPFVGRAGMHDGLYFIGGFGGWGMTKAIVSATLVADEIEGLGRRSLRGLLSPDRFHRAGAWPGLLKENLETAGRLVFPTPEQKSAAAALTPMGLAAGVEPPRCTHLGCRTKVNMAEHTLDCPCHGSRFADDGTPLYGPARRDVTVKSSDETAGVRNDTPPDRV